MKHIRLDTCPQKVYVACTHRKDDCNRDYEMQRTQIYLTEEGRKALKIIADPLGRSQSAIIRAAVDDYIKRYEYGNRLELLRRGRGLWADRNDLPDFQAVRDELDRI